MTRVLLAEDDPTISEPLARALRREGYIVTLAEDGRSALREALSDAYPELSAFELIDFRVRILDASHGTDATTRVLIETSDETGSWQTVGVAPNIVHASWTALVDSFTYGLLKRGVQPRP